MAGETYVDKPRLYRPCLYTGHGRLRRGCVGPSYVQGTTVQAMTEKAIIEGAITMETIITWAITT